MRKSVLNAQSHYCCFFVFLRLGIARPAPPPENPAQIKSPPVETPPRSPAPCHLLCLILPCGVNFLPFCDFLSFPTLALANDTLLHVIIIVYICFPQNITAPLPCLTRCHTHTTLAICPENRSQSPRTRPIRDGTSEESH